MAGAELFSKGNTDSVKTIGEGIDSMAMPSQKLVV